MKKEVEESKDIEKFNGIIFPYLTHLYRLLIRPTLDKLNLFVDIEFWSFLSLGLLSLVFYLKGVSIYWPLIFLGGALTVLILYNSDYFRRKLFPTPNEIINEFISEINNKHISEVLKLIKQYQLNVEGIKKILESKYKKNHLIYLYIHKQQTINSELITYILSKDLIKIMGVDLFSKYLLKSEDYISYDTYNHLKDCFKDNVKIIKTINICCPFFLKNHKIFKFFTCILIKVKNSFNYGVAKLALFVISAVFLISRIIKQPSVFHIDANLEGKALFNEYFSNLVVFLFLAIAMALLLFYIIKFIFGIYRGILFIFAPKIKDKDERWIKKI